MVEGRCAEGHLPGVRPGHVRVRHVALAARPDGEHGVPAFMEQFPKALVFRTRDRTVAIHVDLCEALRERVPVQLGTFKRAVGILVSTFDDNVEWLDLDSGARITASGPAREI